jgi:hypothetical protein
MYVKNLYQTVPLHSSLYLYIFDNSRLNHIFQFKMLLSNDRVQRWRLPHPVQRLVRHPLNCLAAIKDSNIKEIKKQEVCKEEDIRRDGYRVC